FSKSESLNLKMLRELQPGDFVTHIDHGVGRYSGLQKIEVNGSLQEAIRLVYRDNDLLYVSINSLHKISKYVGKEGKAPRLTKLGSETWTNLKRRTKKKVKDIAGELIKLYAKRRASKGFAFPEDGYLQNELEASFIYEDTPDQEKSTADVKADMEKPYPMDRLICGDVGFGKTEIAIRAAFKAVVAGKQVAILVPTTILALQHHNTFNGRLGNFGVTVDYLNRFKTAKEKRELLEKLKEGKVDIVIGTHALLNKKVGFKDLGLLVIDEEQKFGVGAKEKLRNLKVNVDTLTLTATPIPRTLQFSLMSARDLSVINTAPPNRQPIHTEVRTFNDELIKDSIYYEIYRGGQVFFLHNRVKDLPEIAGLLRRLCPDIDIAMAHGQMDPKDLERTLIDFIEGKYDLLVCTNIIETGLDIPNANTIIINNAHHFGLSDLHQLRGRVGRSNKKAFCYLFCPPLSVLTPEARKRLRTIEEFSDLGSGFNIAMRDLDIRGAGNLLGGEQSGFITDIGYETYQKILDEAIQELKENEFKAVFKEDLKKERKFVRDVHIETDIEMMIPDDFVNNIQERLNLYTELDKIENEVKLDAFAKMLRDRFGKLPPSVQELFDGLRLRWLCKELGFERVILKNRKLRCYFIENQNSPYYETQVFTAILGWVPRSGDRHLSFKQSRDRLVLIREQVHSLKKALNVLQQLKSQSVESYLTS
ncbi:MAG: transcription-repair coupling factor, partial [Bacteroidota bacterium]